MFLSNLKALKLQENNFMFIILHCTFDDNNTFSYNFIRVAMKTTHLFSQTQLKDFWSLINHWIMIMALENLKYKSKHRYSKK